MFKTEEPFYVHHSKKFINTQSLESGNSNFRMPSPLHVSLLFFRSAHCLPHLLLSTPPGQSTGWAPGRAPSVTSSTPTKAEGSENCILDSHQWEPPGSFGESKVNWVVWEVPKCHGVWGLLTTWINNAIPWALEFRSLQLLKKVQSTR